MIALMWVTVLSLFGAAVMTLLPERRTIRPTAQPYEDKK